MNEKMIEAVQGIEKMVKHSLDINKELFEEERVQVEMFPSYVGSDESTVTLKIKLLPEFTQEEKIEAVAKRFIDASYGNVEIRKKDLDLIGVGELPYEDGWEGYCSQIYEKLTGQKCPESHARGRGFRSQHYGKEVAKAIREKFSEKVIA
jgi:hypothetical protein